MSNLNPKIEVVPNKLLIGMQDKMMHSEKYKIGQLWQRFMPQRKKILKSKDNCHIAVQVYDAPNDFGKPFEIWAAVEVSDLNAVPDGMSKLIIPQGTYAIFTLKGIDIGGLYQNIMTNWLPISGYQVDNRPHFQVMDNRYKNGSPDSEEDVYLPVIKVQ